MTEIGPYTVVRELGRGGMGIVYEVRHPEIPRPLALKLQLDVADPRALARFQREVELLARLRHPGVVAVHSSGQTHRGQPYLVTEMVSGEDLHELTRRQVFTPQEAARLTAEVASGVGALHAAGIIHRDLKPRNVILTPEGRAVLLDLGVARDLSGERLTRTGQMLGTPAYMAPEQVDNSKAVDERCDVYGLGAILFTLLSGRAPFVAHGFPALLKKILTAPPEWPKAPAVPAPLRAIGMRALAKDPNDRPPNAKALAAELEAYLAGEAPAGSRLPLVVASGLLLLALVVIAVLIALPGDEHEHPQPVEPRPAPAPSQAGETPTVEPATPFPKEALARLAELARESDVAFDMERALAYRNVVEWLRKNGEREPGRAERIRDRLSEGGATSIRSRHLLKTIIQDAPAGAVPGGGFLDDERIALHATSLVNPVVFTRRLDEPAGRAKRLKARVLLDEHRRGWSSVLRASAIHRAGGGRTDLVFASDNHRVYWYEASATGQELSPRVRKRENLDEQGDETAFWAASEGAPVAGGRKFSELAFSPDGELLAVAGDWPVVFLLDRKGVSRQIGAGHLPRGVRDLAFSSNGEYLLTTAYRGQRDQAAARGDAQLFRVKTGEHVRSVEAAAGAARVTALPHPQRTLFVLAVQPHETPARLLVYDVASKAPVFLQAEIPRAQRKGERLGYAHVDPVDDLVTTADGKRVYSASRAVSAPGVLSVWDTEDPDDPSWIREASLNWQPWVRLALSPGEHWILVLGSQRETGPGSLARGGPVHLFGAGDW